ncbi:hypothetical protein B0H10DRAFT_2001787 [Mycena sp. CBHHK59/15]|nr:hypothetical protein B0H10DRAFT_2001787 [Mycena sp. CBHHK59/15]
MSRSLLTRSKLGTRGSISCANAMFPTRGFPYVTTLELVVDGRFSDKKRASSCKEISTQGKYPTTAFPGARRQLSPQRANTQRKHSEQNLHFGRLVGSKSGTASQATLQSQLTNRSIGQYTLRAIECTGMSVTARLYTGGGSDGEASSSDSDLMGSNRRRRHDHRHHHVLRGFEKAGPRGGIVKRIPKCEPQRTSGQRTMEREWNALQTHISATRRLILVPVEVPLCIGREFADRDSEIGEEQR